MSLVAALMNSRKQASVPKVKVSKHKKEIDLSVLAIGGETEWEGLKVSVHTKSIDKVLPKYNYMFVDALGNRVYISCRKADKAQLFVDTFYGKGKYRIRQNTD